MAYFSGFFRFWCSVKDELESLVKFILNLFAVALVVQRILSPTSFLLFGIFNMLSV